MSTERIPSKAGWATASKLPKGPNGRALCRKCSDEVPAHRRTFCSDDCVHQWKITTQPVYARRQVELRDKGVCASCGLDTKALLGAHGAAGAHARHLYNQLHDLDYSPGEVTNDHRRRWAEWSAAVRAVEAQADALLITLGFRPHRHAWEADHIVPVVEGGGACGLDNLRTLCVVCHKHATAGLAARRAAARRPQLALPGTT